MNHDQIAIYLNEHLEFFNDYPELLHKIKQIKDSDLPLERLKTLSIADRIIKRAHDDKEHMKSKLEWFVEITQANEKIQEHLFEIERAILSSLDLGPMILQLKEELVSRFDMHHVVVCLQETSEQLLEGEMRRGQELEEVLRFVDESTLCQWFATGTQPVLKGELKDGSAVFNKETDQVQSEALIPIIIRGEIAGAICLGSSKAFHFYEGLRTDYLERMADKLGIAIDNIFLLDRLRRQPVLDKATGLYNASYLEPVLQREFDRARRYQKPLSILKMHIDSPRDLGNTSEDSRDTELMKEVGRILVENSRGEDSMIRFAHEEFLVLLPGIENRRAMQIAERMRTALENASLPESAQGTPDVRMGVATYPSPALESPTDLVHAVNRALHQARENGTRLISA